MLKPNYITLLGLGLAFIALFTPLWTALVLFSCSFLLDLLDGWVARKYKLVTRFGGVLDSVCDKLVELLFIYYLINAFNLGSLGVLAGGLSIMISYVKQRAGLQKKIKSFFDRAQRLIYLLITVILFSDQINLLIMIYNALCAGALIQLMVMVYAKDGYNK